ncbi:hypothetical protein Tco_0740348, partial [Tanacetum coccineum]
MDAPVVDVAAIFDERDATKAAILDLWEKFSATRFDKNPSFGTEQVANREGTGSILPNPVGVTCAHMGSNSTKDVNASIPNYTSASKNGFFNDEASPSIDTPIVKSVSIPKPVSYAGTAGAYSSKPSIGKANSRHLKFKNVFEGVQLSIPMNVVQV